MEQQVNSFDFSDGGSHKHQILKQKKLPCLFYSQCQINQDLDFENHIPVNSNPCLCCYQQSQYKKLDQEQILGETPGSQMSTSALKLIQEELSSIKHSIQVHATKILTQNNYDMPLAANQSDHKDQVQMKKLEEGDKERDKGTPDEHNGETKKKITFGKNMLPMIGRLIKKVMKTSKLNKMKNKEVNKFVKTQNMDRFILNNLLKVQQFRKELAILLKNHTIQRQLMLLKRKEKKWALEKNEILLLQQAVVRGKLFQEYESFTKIYSERDRI